MRLDAVRIEMRLPLTPTFAATLLVVLAQAEARGAENISAAAPSGQAVDTEVPASKPLGPRRDQPWTLPEATDPSEANAPLAFPRRSAIYWTFGFGTPNGVSGFEAVHLFSDWFELAAGVGEGLGAGTSQPHPSVGHLLQWSFMPRLRVGDARNALTVGVGLSGGEYTSHGLCVICGGDGSSSQESTYPTYYTLWTNFEVGGERWSRSGFAFRYFLGYAQGAMLGSPPPSASTFLAFPYFGIGLGYAF
jgi:hypothetical protein